MSETDTGDNKTSSSPASQGIARHSHEVPQRKYLTEQSRRSFKWKADESENVLTDVNARRSSFDALLPDLEDFHDPVRLNEMRLSGCVIDPRRSTWSAKWDLLMISCLLFTAVVTPVEIVFLDEGAQITALWMINRAIDFCFLLDLVLSFHLAFQRPASNGSYYVVNQRVIIRHYLTGWFVIDFISVLPVWTATLDYASPWPYSAASLAGAASDMPTAPELLVASANLSNIDASQSAISAATLPRIVRLLRMIKLARVLKASRVLQRNILDVLMHEFGTTYAFIKIVKLVALLVLFAHWQACLWGMGSTYPRMLGAKGDTWIADYEESEWAKGNLPTWFDRYTVALYWSVMTLTSIGYGDVSPQNTLERFLAAVCMLASGMMWTYAIGTVATIASTLNPHSIAFTQTMDSLNFFMRDRGLPKPMRFVLRTFFENSRLVRQKEEDQKLFEKMSPLLQCSVALEANRRWVRAIWYLKGVDHLPPHEGGNLIMRLSRCIRIRCFILNERLPLGLTYIMGKGIVVKNWKFLGIGRVWGEDILLDNEELVDHTQAVALVYTETYTLSRISFIESINEFPKAKALISKAIKRVSVYRAMLIKLINYNAKEPVISPDGVSLGRQKTVDLVRATSISDGGRRRPMSFCPKSCASGYEKADDSLSLDQKINVLMDSVMMTSGKEGDDRYARIDTTTSGKGGDDRYRDRYARIDTRERADSSIPAASGSAGPSERSIVTIDASVLATLMADVSEIKEMLKAQANEKQGEKQGFNAGFFSNRLVA